MSPFFNWRSKPKRIFYRTLYKNRQSNSWLVSLKGDLGIAKNYRGITLTTIAAKVYNALLHNRIEPKIEKILKKNQNGFRRNRSNNIICQLLQGFWHRGKLEQILFAYGLPPQKKAVVAIMMLYKTTKVKVRSPDGDTDYLDIVAGVLQGDTLAPYLFIISLGYVLRTSINLMKENSFKLAKERSRRYPAQTITDADYAYDIALLAITPPQAETLIHSLERKLDGIHVL